MTTVLAEIRRKTDHSKKNEKEDERLLLHFRNVLSRYIMDEKELQVESLFALQKHFHDSGYPLKLFARFRKLLADIVSEEAVKSWRESDDHRFSGKRQAMEDMGPL